MTKLSALPPNSSPLSTDSLVSVQASGPTDVLVTIANLAKIIQAVSFNPYKFSVYRNAAWTDGNATFAQVIFDTKNFDTGTNYSTSTGNFTVPVTGYYQFNATAGGSVTTGNLYILAINNTTVGITIGESSGNQGGSGGQQAINAASCLVKCTAGDVINCSHYGSGGAGITGQGIQFSGYLVSVT